MRNTRQKDIIYSALCEYCVHPTADELFQHIHKTYSDIGVATVYRNLNKMAESGKIKKLVDLAGVARYDSVTKPHFHLYCDCCGGVHDIMEDIGSDLVKRAEQDYDCKILSLEISFRGLCRKCQEHLRSNINESAELVLV